MSHRRHLVLIACLLSPALAIANGLGTVLSDDYVDERHLTLIRFGEHHSHYLQPWRAYLETVPAHRFVDGIGVCLPTAGKHDAKLICRMLAEHGFTCGRVEIGWGQLNYDDETKLNGADKQRELLAAMREYGIRPLILLNAHQGAPCPVRFFERTVTKDATKGDRTLVLDKADDLVVGHSGPCNLTHYWAAQALVTNVDGTTIELSKPLPEAVEAGTKQRWATLKYRPFGKPDSEDYRQTMEGWQRYTRTVATFVAEALGTAGESQFHTWAGVELPARSGLSASADVGFDLEVWNELTFGTEFLYVNHYYEPKLHDYDERGIWDRLVATTAEELDANPELYGGVKLVNGFANTIPWPASSTQPSHVTGICKHPYAGPKHYPKDEPKSKPLGADGQPTTFVPTYLAHFPEYYACALQTETMCRDLSPLTTNIYRTKHGRLARPDAEGGLVSVWITEVNFDAAVRGITDPDEAMRLKAKAAARYFCFFLNKGVEKLFLYNATGHKGDGELDLATLAGSFNEYTRTNDTWPDDADRYVSPQLRLLGRIADVMKDGLDRDLDETREIGVASITDTHNHRQFDGDGTPQCPPLYNREVLAVLPYQVNARTFVIPYYVMTRDVVQDLPPEEYTLTLSRVHGEGGQVRVLDPVTGGDVPVDVTGTSQQTLTLVVSATDYPRLLVVREVG